MWALVMCCSAIAKRFVACSLSLFMYMTERQVVRNCGGKASYSSNGYCARVQCAPFKIRTVIAIADAAGIAASSKH